MIIKFILITIGLIISINTFSQEKALKELSIGLISYLGVSDAWGIEYQEGMSSYHHIPRMSVSGGIEMLKEIKNKRLYFEIGILIIDRGYIEYRTNYYYSLSKPSQRIEITNLHVEKHYYLTVPFSIISKNDWFYYGGGLNLGYFLISKKKEILKNRGTDTKSLSYNGNENNFFENILIGFQLKAGLMKKINEKFSFRSELYTSATLPMPFLNYGIGLGLDYKIN